MNRIKQLALSSVVMTLAVSGFAYAQTSDAPKPPAATSAQAPAMTQDDGTAMDDGDVMDQADDLDDGDEMDVPDDAMGDEPADSAEMPAPPKPGMPGPQAGRDRPGHRGGAMGWLDTNKDGTIEKDEFQGRRVERLKAADTDGDGTLSQQELENMVLKQIAERRARKLEKRLDINGDGKVTIAEIQTMRDKEVAVMDRNDDGKIDGRELAEFHRGMGPKHPGMERGGRHGDMRGRHGMHGKHHGRHGERHGRHGGEGMHHGPDGQRMMRGGDQN